MVVNNPYFIQTEIKKPQETVYEIKSENYQVPSFEEFMKDYRVDENLNYEDLTENNLGIPKSYGPGRPGGERGGGSYYSSSGSSSTSSSSSDNILMIAGS